MGQKANPIGNRLGIIRGWESNWYADKKSYATRLIEDHKIRTYLNARINKGGISKIVIERTLGKLIITIHTSKPGIIIGKGGGEVDRIKEELKKSPCDIYEKKLMGIAKELILTSDLSIAEIARQLTFDPSNFTKFFKHFEGITPKQFRELAAVKS